MAAIFFRGIQINKGLADQTSSSAIPRSLRHGGFQWLLTGENGTSRTAGKWSQEDGFITDTALSYIRG